MAAGSGWMPLREPSRQGREAFHISPFNRLARVHAASSAGDVMVAVALAGSLFFSIDPTQARWRVGLYLLLTLAPFAIVAPFIGPAIDRFRGGSRWVILMTCAARSFIAFLMTRHLDGLLLFPEAFAMLVFAKGYQVARSAYVPVTVRSDTELVRANSSLALIAALAGPVGALPAGLVHVVLGSHWVVGLSMVPFAAGAVLAGKLPAPAGWSLAAQSNTSPGAQAPPAPPADVPPEAVADESGFPVDSGAATLPDDGAADGEVAGVGGPSELSSEAARSTAPGPNLSPEAREHSIFLAVSTMGLLRGVVGFLTFLLAFALRSKGGVAGFGLVLTAAGLGNLAGSFVAPKLREVLREDQMLTACLLTTAVVGLLAGLVGGLGAALLVVGIVGVASATGKLAFDSLVQRDARASDKGRLLAQFEARFQMLWVVGAFIPVVIPLPARIGYLLIGALAAAGSISYFVLRQPLGAVVGQMTKAGAGRVIANGSESASGRPAPRSRRRRDRQWRAADGVAPGVAPPPTSTPPAARRPKPARPRPTAGRPPNSWTLPGEHGDEWGRP